MATLIVTKLFSCIAFVGYLAGASFLINASTLQYVPVSVVHDGPVLSEAPMPDNWPDLTLYHEKTASESFVLCEWKPGQRELAIDDEVRPAWGMFTVAVMAFFYAMSLRSVIAAEMLGGLS